MSLSLSAILLLSVPETNGLDATIKSSEGPEVVHVPAHPVTIAQIRYQRRVIIRVPRKRASQIAPMADFASPAAKQTFREKKIGKCLPMNRILGVQIFGDRFLDLLTRDRRRVRARLEKNCPARSFYSGFYMEKSEDGKMCVDRDLLHSRTGSKCEFNRLRELVPNR